MAWRFLLMGCGKCKAAGPAAARDLYRGGLSKIRFRYASARVAAGSADGWAVLSARHGVLSPAVVVAPYDVTIRDLDGLTVAALGCAVVDALISTAWEAGARSPADVCVEVHAGADYRAAVWPFLAAAGFVVTAPAPVVGIGQLLGWYLRQTAQLEMLEAAAVAGVRGASMALALSVPVPVAGKAVAHA